MQPTDHAEPAGLPARDPAPAARPAALVVAGIGLVTFVGLALWLVPWGWVEGVRVRAVAPEVLLTPEQVERARAYSGAQRVLGWVGLVLSLAALWWLALSRRGRRLARLVPGPWWVRVVAGTALVLAVVRLVTLPVSVVARQRSLEFGLTTQGWTAWAGDVVRAYAVDLAVSALALVVLVALARRLPRRWPVAAGVGVAGLVVAGSFAYPLVVEPVFNRFEPLPDGSLRSGILALAEREEVAVDEVLVADASRRTTTLNAYVSGFGATKRVVVYDTLLDGLTEEQALTVVAHELAHARHDDVVVGTVLGAAGAAAGVGVLALLLGSRGLRRRADVAGAHDPAVVAPVLALVAVGTLLVSPVENGTSRAIEARADVTALRATQDPDAFVSMQHRLTSRSLADPQPPAWSRWAFASHPGALQRVALVEALGFEVDFDPAAEVRRVEAEEAARARDDGPELVEDPAKVPPSPERGGAP